MNKVWKVKSEGNTFVSFITVAAAHAVCDHVGAWFVNMFIAHFALRLVWRIKKKSSNMYLIAVILSLVDRMQYYPVFALVTMSMEQNLLHPWLHSVVSYVHDAMDRSLAGLPSASFPTFGTNANGVLEPFYEALLEIRSNLYETLHVDKRTTGTWLRGNGVTTSPLNIADKPAIAANAIREAISSNLNLYRWLYAGTIVICSLMFLHAPGILLIAVVAYCYSKFEVMTHDITKGGRMGPIRNGIYHINTTVMNVSVGYGIGVCVEGILHVPYHVCHARRITIGKTQYAPYYINPSEDIVTYNGPPQITSPKDGDVIFVNCETLDSRTSYMVEVDISGPSGMITWQGVTRPGESGSPVYLVKGDNLVLAGLAGRYYRDTEGNVTEYTELKPGIEEGKGIQQHIHYPGYGKTRKVIPSIIAAHLLKNPRGRILVTGPTRVVCKELALSLSNHFKVGCMIGDSPGLKNVMAPVQIAAHATMMKMLTSKERVVSSATCLIIDEAHFMDASTKMLRTFARHFHSKGGEVHELSATLDGQYSTGSNYTITDKQLTEKEVIPKAKELLEEGKRVMIFVPGMRGTKGEACVKELQKYKPVILSRQTFAAENARISDVNNRLVISTDIAECGINVPDLDVVIDYGKKFDYFVDNKIVYGMTVPINMASYVQRRGRVGRTKEGEYYYANVPAEYLLPTAAELDADIMSTGREWSMGTTNEFDIFLSVHQLNAIWKNSEVPTAGAIKYARNGVPLGMWDRSQVVEALRNKKDMVPYIGCPNKDCPCAGSWKWFDERIHDVVMNTGTGIKIMEV